MALCLAAAAAGSDDLRMLGRSDDQKLGTVGGCLFVHPQPDGLLGGCSGASPHCPDGLLWVDTQAGRMPKHCPDGLMWVDTQAIASLAMAPARAVSDDSIKLGRSDDQKPDTVGGCHFVHPRPEGGAGGLNSPDGVGWVKTQLGRTPETLKDKRKSPDGVGWVKTQLGRTPKP